MIPVASTQDFMSFVARSRRDKGDLCVFINVATDVIKRMVAVYGLLQGPSYIGQLTYSVIKLNFYPPAGLP